MTRMQTLLRGFWKMPFRRKLTLTTLAVTGVTLLVALLGILAVQYVYERDKSDEQNKHIAEVLASNLGPAVAFEDAEAADTITNSARSVPDIILIEARAADGREISTYFDSSKSRTELAKAFAGENPHEQSWLDTIGSYSTPILVDGEQIGSLVIGYQYRSLSSITYDILPVTAFLFFICLGFGSLVASALKNMVFKPLDRLNNSMEAVQLSGDLAERVRMSDDPDFDKIIRNYNTMLSEIEVSTRELSMAMDELAMARDEAENANVAKSAFLANMSHELRTPLNAIIGYTEVLRDDLEAVGLENSVEDIGWIYSSSIHLLELINGLLDLSKIEAGHMEIDIHPFDIRDLLSEVEATLRPLAARNKNTISLSIDESLGVIRSDSTKLRQCLLNLGSNACKFTEAGYIEIGARCDDAMLVLEVSDTGIGIAEENIARLFEPFVQNDSSTTRRFGGTGLGLTLIKRFTEMLGGTVEVNSDLGFGSTFTLRIPFNAQAAAKPLASSPDVESEAGEVMHRGKRERAKPLALVIDDEPSAVQLLRRVAERNGYDCQVATNGEEGLNLARSTHPDLVLLDIAMPILNGWKVLEVLAADKTLRHIPTVVISVDDRKRLSLEHGASEHLVKPINTDDLETILQFYSDKREGEILLVEDDPATAQLYHNGLKQCGFKVTLAGNGNEAAKLLDEKQYGLVVTDLMMPGSDGFELVTKIGQMPVKERPLVMAMTGFTLEDEQRKMLGKTVKSIHLKQGFTPRQLAAHVSDLLEWEGRPRAMQADAEPTPPADSEAAPQPEGELSSDPVVTANAGPQAL